MSAPTLLPGRPTGEDVCLAVWLHWRCWTEVLSTARSGDGGCPVLALAGRSFVNQTASTKDTHTHAHALHGSLTGVRGKVKLEGTRHLHRPATFMLTRPGPPATVGQPVARWGCLEAPEDVSMEPYVTPRTTPWAERELILVNNRALG